MSDTAEVGNMVRRVYDDLRNGGNFAEFAQKYSDDTSSNRRGGDIGYYDREKLRPDIATMLYGLPVGSLGAPYRQPYGYHIFKVTDRRPVPSFSETEIDLRANYQQRSYANDYRRYVDNLKHVYGITLNFEVNKQLRTSFDMFISVTYQGRPW